MEIELVIPSQKHFSTLCLNEKAEMILYENFDIPDLNHFKNILYENTKLKGLNVTIPYKESIFKYLDKN